MKPTLVVLAAGMGSRYGGLKQVDPVGPAGEAILDYSVYDAIRGGFGKVVFIICKDFEAEFKEKVGKKYEGLVPVDYCYQDLNDLPAPYTFPEGRTKPWGTAHAVRAADKDYDGVLAVTERYLKRSADNNHLQLAKVDALVKKGRFKEAMAFLRTVKVLPSENADGAWKIWNAAEKALGLDPTYPENLGSGAPFTDSDEDRLDQDLGDPPPDVHAGALKKEIR